ncbi:hypothetical protein B0H66DRAFT_543005 [Apodospora peruviana]|uniref:Uncharacterized protein n=1 Tax=Apodospora peruviana TaxID=516989 RepID=A0AAE0IRX5_9PEZI|nr:hypothetical protein B0H66DRAFT_543005 [Apodospora peruviana]
MLTLPMSNIKYRRPGRLTTTPSLSLSPNNHRHLPFFLRRFCQARTDRGLPSLRRSMSACIAPYAAAGRFDFGTVRRSSRLVCFILQPSPQLPSQLIKESPRPCYNTCCSSPLGVCSEQQAQSQGSLPPPELPRVLRRTLYHLKPWTCRGAFHLRRWGRKNGPMDAVPRPKRTGTNKNSSPLLLLAFGPLAGLGPRAQLNCVRN